MKHKTKGITIKSLVEEYEKEKKSSTLEVIMQNLILETLTDDEYMMLFNIPHQNLKILVALKSPKNILLKLLNICDDNDVVNYIFERINNEKIKLSYHKILHAKNPFTRRQAFLHVSQNALLKRINAEEDQQNLELILSLLRNYKFDNEQIYNFLNSKNTCVRKFFISKASGSLLIDRLDSETDVEVVKLIIERLDSLCYIPIENELRRMVSSNYEDVRVYAYKFISTLDLVESIKIEENIEVLVKASRILNMRTLKKIEANKLIESKSRCIRECAYKYASIDKIIEALKREENRYLANILIKRLNNVSVAIDSNLADKLLQCTNEVIRNFAVKYASEKKIIKLLAYENNEKIVSSCIERLDTITENQAGSLINAPVLITRCFAIKFAARSKILKRLSVENNKVFISEAINRVKVLS